jgi:23S rRNA U2552 (ribose-2'-O)-methylase RlmE/FtsJ
MQLEEKFLLNLSCAIEITNDGKINTTEIIIDRSTNVLHLLTAIEMSKQSIEQGTSLYFKRFKGKYTESQLKEILRNLTVEDIEKEISPNESKTTE